MKFRPNTSRVEMPVLAIYWPKPDLKKKIFGGVVETSFAAFDGNGLQDFYENEVTFTNREIENFEFSGNLDDRYFILMWAPILRADLWEKIREYDIDAINTLKELLVDLQ